MGKQIEPQTRQIILRVIQFCEEEKKKGLLAPPQQAIKRACLATGLSKYTILKIRNEAQNATVDNYVDEYINHGDDEILGTDIHEESGPSSGLDPAASNIETILVKVEPLQEEDSSQHGDTASIPSESGLGHCVLVKTEPRDDNEIDYTHAAISYNVKCVYEDEVPLHKRHLKDECEDNGLNTTVMKCEFESPGDPLFMSSSECAKQDGLTQGAASCHITKCKNQNLDKENSSKKKSNAPSSKATGTGRHECHICNRQLSSASKLKAHVTLHSGEKPFSCPICQSKYSHKKYLQRHLKIHTDKQYQCSICQKSFTENSKLNRHIKSHTGEKSFGCNLCERRFIRNEELQIHLRTHTGEKPYKCNVCNDMFRQKITLQKHLRTHTGEKTHQCRICHSWFTCNYSLQVHSRIHTGERPYECNVCPSRFAQSIHLVRHLRTHGVSEKHYECDVCGNRYPEKYHLKVHIQSCHSGLRAIV